MPADTPEAEARRVLADMTANAPGTQWLSGYVQLEAEAIIRAMLAFAEASHARGYRAAVEEAGGLPDDIDLFRTIRRAGRSDRAKAQAIDALLEPVRTAIRALGASDGGEG